MLVASKMTKLTEDMVIARTRTSDLATIKKFNCWGSDLHDISIIRKFSSVEVLSLSINRISTLADIAYCQNLVELYIRRNEISDLSEICYLQETPRLKRLLLSENPCVDSLGPLYRPTVLRCLPGLEQLDGEDVLPEEVEHAMQHGLILQHPLQTKRERVSPEPMYYRDSPPMPSSQSQQPVQLQRNNQYEYESESPPQYRTVSHSPPAEYHHYYNGSQVKTGEVGSNAIGGAGNAIASTIVPSTNTAAIASTNTTTANAVNATNGLTSPRNGNSSASNSHNASPTNIPAQPNSTAPTVAPGQNPALQRRISSPEYGKDQQMQVMLSNGRRQSADCNNYEYQHEYLDSPMRSAPNSAREVYSNNNVRTTFSKTRTKSSNLLSAVLCLIPELDWASLEVVELAVKRRMDEFPGD